MPATGVIVIDFLAVFNCSDTINNRSGLIEFKRYLGQVVEIAVWMRTHHKRNLWFGEPDFKLSVSSGMLICDSFSRDVADPPQNG
jgi:hypothetical protein